MADLFQADPPAPVVPAETAPLADRLRPASLDEVVGQEHLTGTEGAIGRMVAAGKLSSLILWGPPGTGKTTLAYVIAASTKRRFRELSALTAGVKDVRLVVEEAKRALAELRERKRAEAMATKRSPVERLRTRIAGLLGRSE